MLKVHVCDPNKQFLGHTSVDVDKNNLSHIYLANYFAKQVNLLQEILCPQ